MAGEWQPSRRAGIVAVISKATQGRGTQDDTYFGKKNVIKAAGLKWGSYHYSSGSDPILQVENYLQQPDNSNNHNDRLDQLFGQAGDRLRACNVFAVEANGAPCKFGLHSASIRRQPSVSSSWTNSCTSRDFPMPGSPVRHTVRPPAPPISDALLPLLRKHLAPLRDQGVR